MAVLPANHVSILCMRYVLVVDFIHNTLTWEHHMAVLPDHASISRVYNGL